MKKFFLTFSTAMLVLFPLITHAQLGSALGNLEQAVGEKSGTGLSGDLAGTIGTVVKGVLALVGTIFLLLTIYAGILWMTAAGNEEKITKAKGIITATVIGLAIVMSAYAITYFVTSKLGGGGGGSQAPTCADAGGQCIPAQQAGGKTIIQNATCPDASLYCVK